MTDRFVSLLRHGEPQGGGRFRGGHDDPLSDAGWAQMWAQVRCGGLEHLITRVVSSPARRCAEFAQALAEARGLPLAISPALGERCFGDWEGLAAHEIPPDELTRFWDDPVGYSPPNAEAFAAFRQRILAGWAEVLAGADAHTLVVTHGGGVRVILAQVLGLTDSSGLLIEVAPAALSRLRVPMDPGRPSLMLHCGTPEGTE
jgi:broad specificity phosphatase PhoE